MECLSAPPLLLCEWGSWLSAHVRFYELSCTSPALWHLYSSTPTGMAAPAGGGGLCIYDNSADIGTTLFRVKLDYFPVSDRSQRGCLHSSPKPKRKKCHARLPSSRSLPPSRVAQRRPRLRQSRRRRRARPRRSTRALHRTWRRPGIRALPLRRAGKIWSLQVSARNKSPHDNAHAAPKFRGSNRCAPALPATGTEESQICK